MAKESKVQQLMNLLNTKKIHLDLHTWLFIEGLNFNKWRICEVKLLMLKFI